jgi:hypothetical protein
MGGPGPAPVRVPEWGDDPDVQSLLAAQQAAVIDRLEAGLEVIQRRADRLMRQVGAEVYKATQKAQGEAPQLKDDAARSILTYVDERFQTLSLAMGRLEQAVHKLAQATGDVLLRTEQSRQMVDRVAETSAQYAQRNQAALGNLAIRLERSLQPLDARMDAVEAAVKAATARNRADLTAFTQRTSEGLARVGQRLREGFAAMTRRAQEQDDALVTRIESAVASEVERLERIMREQAARSVAAAEQVSRAAAESAARTEASLGMLGHRLETTLSRAADESIDVVDRAVSRMANRQQEILAEAIQEAESRQEAEPPPTAPTEPVNWPPAPARTPDPESEAAWPVADGDAPPEPMIDDGLQDLRAAIADLGELDERS